MRRAGQLIAAEILGEAFAIVGRGVGIETVIARNRTVALADARIGQLPTGQARLVELARSLASNPKVLLLDEPASGQTEQETEAFAKLLGELATEGIAVVLVEHDVPLVMASCQHIHVLDFGRIIAEGSPDQVRDDPAVRAAYLGSEAVA